MTIQRMQEVREFDLMPASIRQFYFILLLTWIK